MAYLVVNRARDVGVGELLAALWPSDSPSLTTLRALVSKTRQVLGQEVVGRGGPYRLVLPAGARVDLEVATEAIHRAEPYRESGYRLLMSALAARGNVADAMLVYERLREKLREDLGIGPGADTRALHQELLDQT